jgi:hypothetical protein
MEYVAHETYLQICEAQDKLRVLVRDYANLPPDISLETKLTHTREIKRQREILYDLIPSARPDKSYFPVF